MKAPRVDTALGGRAPRAVLAPATAVYACGGGPAATGHPAAHAGFARFCRGLRDLDRVLGDEAGDAYWADIRRATRRYRFRAGAAPVRFDDPALGARDVVPALRTLYDRCAFRVPAAAANVAAVLDAFAALATCPDAPLLDVLADLVQQGSGVERAVALPDTHLIAAAQQALAARGLAGVPVLGPAELRGPQCGDVLLVIGPPHWFPEYVAAAPRARQVRVIAYPWMTVPDWPPPLFVARLSDNERTRRPSGAGDGTSAGSPGGVHLTPHAPLQALRAPLPGAGHPPVAAADAVDQLAAPTNDDGSAQPGTDDLANEDAEAGEVPPWLDAAGWAESAVAALPSRPGPDAAGDLDRVRALPLLLDGNAVVFLEAEDGATALVIDLHERGRRRVRRVPADRVEEGMFVLLRAGGGGDYVPLVADALLGRRAAELRRMQAAWKEPLRAAVRRSNLFETSIALLDLGGQRANESNVRRWIWARSIRPHSADDFRAIMRLAGLADEADAYWAGMRLLDRAHARAGQVIRSRLLDQVHASDLGPLERLGRMEFDLLGANTGRMVACRVLAVPAQPVYVAHADAGRLLDLDALWRA